MMMWIVCTTDMVEDNWRTMTRKWGRNGEKGESIWAYWVGELVAGELIGGDHKKGERLY